MKCVYLLEVYKYCDVLQTERWMVEQVFENKCEALLAVEGGDDLGDYLLKITEAFALDHQESYNF